MAMGLQIFYQRLGLLLLMASLDGSTAMIFFPRGGSIGVAGAVTIPLDLRYRNVYIAFNFGSNYGLPSNETHNEWIERWQLNEGYLGVGSDVTPIDGRQEASSPVNNREEYTENSSIPKSPRFTRHDFYRSIVNYLGQFGYNGSACLLRTICEVSAAPLDADNGVLGSIFKILFMPTTSSAEPRLQHVDSLYEASEVGTRHLDCSDYVAGCPHNMLDMISTVF